METKTTPQLIATFAEKKTWENPTLTIIDQNDVNGGPVDAVAEGTAAPFITPGNTRGITATNHS